MLRNLVVASTLGQGLALFGNLTDVLKTINEHNSEMVFLKSSKSHEAYPDLLQMHVNAELLNEYGCWCYSGRSGVGRGRGQPIDKFDEICRAMNQAYECVTRDGAPNGDATCDPHTQSSQGYTWEVEYEVNNMKVDTILTCTGDNVDNWCQNTVCEIDMLYTKLYLDLIMDGEEPNYDAFSHSNGFNVAKECKSDNSGSGNGGGPIDPPNGPQPYKKCCGKYPHRWIYRTNKAVGGNRQCCDIEGQDNIGNSRSRTFLTDSHVCCGAQGVQKGETCM